MTTGMVTGERLRQARADDAAALHRMFARCSAATRYGRFHGLLHALPERYLAEAVAGDAAVHDALVVEAADPGELVALGSARRCDAAAGPAAVDPATLGPAVEIGLLVEDAAQHRGLGRRLLLALAGRARSRGVAVLHCDVLAGNHRLLDTLRSALGPVSVRSEGPVLHASVRLLVARPPLPWRAP